MPDLEFSVLGPLVARRDDEHLALGGGKRALLLALLVIEAGRPITRDRLIDELWGEQPPETAVTALQGLVSQLRRLLEDEASIENGSWRVLAGHGSGYGLMVPSESVDVRGFLARIASARDAGERGDHGATLAAADAALALWRGRPLLGFSTPAIDAFARRCEDARLDALEDRADALLGLGRPRDALAAVEPLIEAHPERERLRATQVVALYRCGRQVEALNALASARRRLRDDLGLEPSPALDDLERRILNHDPTLGGSEPPSDAPRAQRPRTRLAIAGGAALTLAAVAIALLHDNSAPGPGATGSGDRVVAIDSTSGDVQASYPVGAGAVGLTSNSQAIWTLNSDDGTLTRIDLRTHSTRTIGTGTTPVDLAVGGGGLWAANGSRTDAQFVGPVVTAVSKLDAVSGVTLRTTALRRSRALTSNQARQHIVATSRGIFVVGADYAISRLDPATGAIRARTSGVRATAVAFGPLGLWALEPTGLVRLAPATLHVLDRVPLASTNLNRLAVGARSVWITDSAAGTLWRVDPAGVSANARTLALDAGIDAVTVSDGAVWVTNPEREELLRVDPGRNAVVARIHLDGRPLGVLAAGHLLWVTLGGQAAPAGDALAAACGPVIYGGSGRPEAVIVSDLPMGAGLRVPARQMSDAIAFVLRAHRYRAGDRTVGYRVCDDWSGSTAIFDPARCRSNGQAYGRDPAVVAVIGPYNSGCALTLIPAANAAPGGPLLVISPTAASTDLTRAGVAMPPGLPRALYPARARNFVRLLPTDDDEGAALAAEAKALGARRIDVLTTGVFGETTRRACVAAATRLGLRVVNTFAYDPAAQGYASLAAGTARDHPDAVVVAGLLDENAGAVIRALRTRLASRVQLIGSSGLLPISALFARAGPAARGVHISLPGLDANHLGAGAHAFERAFGASRQAPVAQAAVYAAAATELVLAALARSNGSRAGVLAAMLRERSSGILGPVRFDAGGDAHPRRIAIVRAERPGGSDALQSLDGSVWERVLSL